MPKFRKKPVVIEAARVGKGLGFIDPPTEWIKAALRAGTLIEVPNSKAWDIKTLEGTMRAEPGDWIIQGVKGELYPCKPDIFAETYEPAEETP